MKKSSPVFTSLMLVPMSMIIFSCATGQDIAKESVEKDALAGGLEEEVVISEVTLGAGDEIEITVYRHNDLNRKVRIPFDGGIYLPLIGEVQAKGVSSRQLKGEITERLAQYIVNPQVSVEITALRSQKVFVLGEVRKPGVYVIDPPMTILDAVSRAGGTTLEGKDNSVLLIRGGLDKPELRALNLAHVLKEGDLSQNVSLQRGDIVYVPRTFISNVDRFFEHLLTIVRPIVYMERGFSNGRGSVIIAP